MMRQFKARLCTGSLREMVVREIDRQIQALPGSSVVQELSFA